MNTPRDPDPRRDESHDEEALREEEAVPLPVDGMLDLHTFSPREVKGLVADYLQACRERGILEVRIVHGKGTGQLRRTVHAVLDRLDFVASYRPAGEDRGGWGATLVTLRAWDGASADPS